MLLEQLAKKETLKVDFHNHLQTGSFFRQKPKNFKEWLKNLFLEEGFSSLTGILDRMTKTDLDVLYITNSNEDARYKDWTSEEQLEIAKKAGYEIEQGEYYTFAKKGERVIALGKSHEVATTRGHFLFSGIKKNKRFPFLQSLEKTLAEATDNELKIADHPYAKLKGQNGVMATSKSPEQDAKIFDAFERNGNFCLPFSLANWKAIKYSKKYNKPLIANSDGHHPRDIGKTYNIFNSKDLNYTSERTFRDSINNSVRENNFTYRFMPIPFWRVFHHAMMIGIHYIMDRFQKK
jgi:predicted metal-dependent phosphoesterase TrpH